MQGMIITVDIDADIAELSRLIATADKSLGEVEGLLARTWLRDDISLGLILQFSNMQTAEAFLSSRILDPLSRHPACHSGLSSRLYAVVDPDDAVDIVVNPELASQSTVEPSRFEPVAALVTEA
jgi:hypothetical protein